MKKRKFISANINGLQVKNIQPLEFGYVVLKKDVPFYVSGLGRLITVESEEPTNTYDEASDWLTGLAIKYPRMEILKTQTVPYIDEKTIHAISMTEEEAKQLRLKRINQKKNY